MALWVALVVLFALMLAGPLQLAVSVHDPHDVAGAVRRWLAVIPNPWPWQVSAGLALAVLLVLGVGRQRAPSAAAPPETDDAVADPTKDGNVD